MMYAEYKECDPLKMVCMYLLLWHHKIYQNLYFYFLPLLLGVTTSFSLPPYNFLILNFITFPLLFFFLIQIQKKKLFWLNFIIGIFFVIGGLVLAAINKIDPVSAAILNVTGSLIVVFNSARLVREGEDFEAFDALSVDSPKTGDYFPEDSGEVVTVSP